MRKITRCGAVSAVPDLVDWSTAEWSLHGDVALTTAAYRPCEGEASGKTYQKLFTNKLPFLGALSS